MRQTLEKISPSLDASEFKVLDYFAYAKKINSKFRLVALSVQNNRTLFSLINQKINAVSKSGAVQSIKASELLNLNLKFPSQETSEPVVATAFNTSAASVKPKTPLEKDFVESVSIQELLSLINRLSLIVTNFIGAQITTTYWKETRPGFNYLSEFEIDKNAQLKFVGDANQPAQAVMQLGFKLWLKAFFDKSSQFIYNLPELIEIECEDQYKQEILSIIPAVYLCGLGSLREDDSSLFGDI